ncbi:flagellar basal body-associated protein FliL [Viridibacillus arvi]|jgi:flagellar FliL protein|uniref:Flagellar protein FliL n=1 Tax=Viridibacillus arvi TaxID=263475 RepID=A0A0M0LEY9_9BACL|nr:flagellar basal body-associated protein FliL [Viridibacillus arvi]KOO49283.1 flagellar basal body-associated protein FliL [Viridibacillus arvi]
MKNNKLLTIMLIILVSITLLGVIALVTVNQLNKGSAEEPSIDEIIEASVDVPELTTNLAGTNFVKISLKIQTDSKKAAKEIGKRDFQVKSIVIEELSEMTKSDLEGKKGKKMLETTLKTRFNELMLDGKVQEVYITSYIIQ